MIQKQTIYFGGRTYVAYPDFGIAFTGSDENGWVMFDSPGVTFDLSVSPAPLGSESAGKE